jgi:hypothetical protein
MLEDCGTDSRKLFATVFQLLDLKKENPLPEEQNSEDLAESFVEFFYEKIVKIRTSLADCRRFEPELSCTTSFSEFAQIPEDHIRRFIMKSKPTTCFTDPLPTTLLKEHLDVLLPTLTRVVNCSLCTGEFSTQWKQSIVKPLLKKSGLDLIRSNYRPVSNIPFISKIVEKAALSQFTPYVEANRLVPDYQSAYRTNHGTETATVKIVNDLLWGMEKGKVTSLVAMDLSAAFDTVDHAVLLNILEKSFGVSGCALSWFGSYLCDRSMCVQINDSFSTPREMNFSVPQGSVAGPVLFTAYVSSLPSIINENLGTIAGYADDHHLYRSFDPNISGAEHETISYLQDSLSAIKTWMDSLVLKMNQSKTEYIQFGSRQQLQKCVYESININESVIERSAHIKFLGSYLDASLTFEKHVQVKCGIAACNIQYVASIRKHITQGVANQLMCSMVLSHLDFANAILAGLPDKTLDKLQSVQNWAAKVVLMKQKNDSSTKALLELHWLPIRSRIIFKVASLVYRCIHRTAPVYLCELLSTWLPKVNTRAAASSRDAILLNVPVIKKQTFANRSFSYNGPRIWNNLPNDLRRAPDYMTFRKTLKTHLFSEYFKDYL